MWLRQFRQSVGLELDEFARVVNTYRRLAQQPVNGIVSNTLIHILEVDEKAVTHPNLANAIATVCGATAEQRDRIVAKEHRGKWKPNKNERALVNKAIWKVTGRFPSSTNTGTSDKQTGDKTPGRTGNRAYMPQRTIAKIDMKGNIIETYDTAVKAGNANNIGEKYVRNRCKRRACDISKYGPKLGFTFRYLDEWKNLTAEQRIADLT